MLNKLDKFHKTKLGYGLFGLAELALAYLFIGWAINDGNWFDYLFALLFIVGFLQNFIKLIGSFLHGASRRKTGKR